MEQKLIRITNQATGRLEKYLEDGWKIKSISATCVGAGTDTFCYVFIEK